MSDTYINGYIILWRNLRRNPLESLPAFVLLQKKDNQKKRKIKISKTLETVTSLLNRKRVLVKTTSTAPYREQIVFVLIHQKTGFRI